MHYIYVRQQSTGDTMIVCFSIEERKTSPKLGNNLSIKRTMGFPYIERELRGLYVLSSRIILLANWHYTIEKSGGTLYNI